MLLDQRRPQGRPHPVGLPVHLGPLVDEGVDGGVQPLAADLGVADLPERVRQPGQLVPQRVGGLPVQEGATRGQHRPQATDRHPHRVHTFGQPFADEGVARPKLEDQVTHPVLDQLLGPVPRP